MWINAVTEGCLCWWWSRGIWDRLGSRLLRFSAWCNKILKLAQWKQWKPQNYVAILCGHWTEHYNIATKSHASFFNMWKYLKRYLSSRQRTWTHCSEVNPASLNLTFQNHNYSCSHVTFPSIKLAKIFPSLKDWFDQPECSHAPSCQLLETSSPHLKCFLWQLFFFFFKKSLWEIFVMWSFSPCCVRDLTRGELLSPWPKPPPGYQDKDEV